MLKFPPQRRARHGVQSKQMIPVHELITVKMKRMIVAITADIMLPCVRARARARARAGKAQLEIGVANSINCRTNFVRQSYIRSGTPKKMRQTNQMKKEKGERDLTETKMETRKEKYFFSISDI